MLWEELSGPMVTALDSKSACRMSSPVSSPGQPICFVLGKENLFSHSLLPIVGFG